MVGASRPQSYSAWVARFSSSGASLVAVTLMVAVATGLLNSPSLTATLSTRVVVLGVSLRWVKARVSSRASYAETVASGLELLITTSALVPLLVTV